MDIFWNHTIEARGRITKRRVETRIKWEVHNPCPRGRSRNFLTGGWGVQKSKQTRIQ